MQLIEVNDVSTATEFIRVNVIINKSVPNYIRPIDNDVNGVFDKKKNKAFRHGECIRWILRGENGELIGRIAAFINKKYKNKGDDGPVGGIGFFDCINNQQAADMLFDVAKHWLLKKGMEAMDGPINFGERDAWWGLVVHGFQEPLFKMNFNAPYYKELFENYGFKKFFDQVCFGMHTKDMLSKKFKDRHAAIAKDPEFSCRHLVKSDLKKYAEDFCIVYNKAWAGHGGNKQLSKEQCIKMFQQMKMVMDEKIVWFAYHKDEPIAIFINLPDLNQWFKHLNGNFNLLHKLKFLWLKKMSKNKRCVGLVFGVVPEWQAKGIDSYIIEEASTDFRTKLDYEDYEMQWIGDFNPKMIAVAENLTPTRSRILTTYRYMFDQTKEFKRHPIL
ncbi:hypothetical protein QEG73_11885 [Chitinophagaceae bacterium 26-R-25]|nr:hypothetical protein [Chitinophagaceae bacterium 26-R-25]